MESIQKAKVPELAPTPSLAPAAQAGFADGSSYDAFRPSYPASAISTLLTSLNVADATPGTVTLLDLAAGTGKMTELLASRPESYNIFAIEPHDGMRRELGRKKLRNVKVHPGFGEKMEQVESGSIDAVVCAQAFHWFSTTSALLEIARVLKPHGRLGLIWNVEDYNNSLSHASPHHWTLELRKYLFKLDDQEPEEERGNRFRNERWRNIFTHGDEGSNYKNPFSLLKDLPTVEWTSYVSQDELWRRFATLSQVRGERESEGKVVFDKAMEGNVVRDGDGKVAVRGVTVSLFAEKA